MYEITVRKGAFEVQIIAKENKVVKSGLLFSKLACK